MKKSHQRAKIIRRIFKGGTLFRIIIGFTFKLKLLSVPGICVLVYLTRVRTFKDAHNEKARIMRF